MAHRIVRKSIYERMFKEKQVKSVFTINIDRNFHSRKHMEQKKTLTITFGANKPKNKPKKNSEHDFIGETT